MRETALELSSNCSREAIPFDWPWYDKISTHWQKAIMGVTGLWTVVAPIARPTKLETLNRKRLAVDASIWIYQFLKAVRDSEGNSLRNSHIVGFFRRICKLLYFGIKPVFVFDGGAPVLKRETIRRRARRREGRRDDAARTAGKLLAVQVARAAEEESKRQHDTKENEEELPDDKDLVYVDEIGLDQQQRQAGRTFKKKDQYHLPELDVSLADMGAPNDPRVMSQAELEDYAKQFHSGEDINLYDFSKIDFDSAFFQSLPAGDKYNILNAARLRSRLRMGYSKDQLDGMFPDRMAFSRFQIERVKERNELTQRLMNVSNSNEGEWDFGGRIAGERGKEYVLVHHEGVEGGWALGVVSNKGNKQENAIDLDDDQGSDPDKAMSEDDDEFEDVAIEGVNRLPQAWKRKRAQMREVDYDVSYEEAAERIAKKRKAVYEGRRKAAEAASNSTPENVVPAPNQQEPIVESQEEPLFVQQDNDDSDEGIVFEDVAQIHDVEMVEDELQRAIAMSLEQPEEPEEPKKEGGFVVEEDEAKSPEEDGFDLSAALAESRLSKHQSKTKVQNRPVAPVKSDFGGPLPFESLNLGKSLLSKKKGKKNEQKLAGGFEKSMSEAKPIPAQPIPDWFDTAADTRPARPGDLDLEFQQKETALKERNQALKKRRTSNEVIDLEADDGEIHAEEPGKESVQSLEVWETFDDEEQIKQQEEADKRALELAEVAEVRRKAQEAERDKRYELALQIARENEEVTMNAVAEEVQTEPPPASDQPNLTSDAAPNTESMFVSDGSDVDWSDSDHEAAQTTQANAGVGKTNRATSGQSVNNSDEDDDIFEDVDAPIVEPPTELQKEPSQIDQNLLMDDDDGMDENGVQTKTVNPAEEDDFFDNDSDEELMLMLANETEEHMRFANELNNTRPKSPNQAIRDYEEELKQLRNQQKKDRRDADEVTQTMIQECQALLRLFGLPYITAPMEAEAQCAELVHLGLVDGIVTDDSDVFLFGGTRIYKNMFNAAKFVECYLSADLEKEFALTRPKLISFAHLLGSDYTEGIPGIGPVSALDIISDFSDLSEFKEWTLKVQLGSQTPSVMDGLLTTPFRRKFKRQVQRKLFLPSTFPDLRVDDAYLDPEVDKNNEQFQWGVPDLERLRSFLMATIGWSQDRTDEVLVPVIRDMNKRDLEGVQSNITRFFQGGVGAGAAPRRGIGGYNVNVGDGVEGTAPRNRTGKESGRMKNAYTRLRKEAEKQKRLAYGKSVESIVESGTEGNEIDEADDEADGQGHETVQADESNGSGQKETTKRTRSGKAKKKSVTKKGSRGQRQTAA